MYDYKHVYRKSEYTDQYVYVFGSLFISLKYTTGAPLLFFTAVFVADKHYSAAWACANRSTVRPGSIEPPHASPTIANR